MKTFVFASLLSLFSSSVLAEASIQDAWARATVPGQPVGAAYMKISSPTATRLVKIETEAAKQVQVHNMHVHDGVMKMREHGQLDIPAGQTVELAPGGMHVMLIGLKNPLMAGETFTMKMTFQDAKNATSTSVVAVPVRPIGK